MNSLYVIGNGFDLAHELPTKYWDFRVFLDENDYAFLTKLMTQKIQLIKLGNM